MFELIFLLTNSSSKTKDIPTAIQTQERSHFLEHAQVGLTWDQKSLKIQQISSIKHHVIKSNQINQSNLGMQEK